MDIEVYDGRERREALFFRESRLEGILDNVFSRVMERVSVQGGELVLVSQEVFIVLVCVYDEFIEKSAFRFLSKRLLDFFFRYVVIDVDELDQEDVGYVCCDDYRVLYVGKGQSRVGRGERVSQGCWFFYIQKVVIILYFIYIVFIIKVFGIFFIRIGRYFFIFGILIIFIYILKLLVFFFLVCYIRIVMIVFCILYFLYN